MNILQQERPSPRGTWRIVPADGLACVVATCPECGRDSPLRQLSAPTRDCYVIDPDGTLRTPFVCPHPGCSHTGALRLAGWKPAASGTKPAEGR